MTHTIVRISHKNYTHLVIAKEQMKIEDLITDLGSAITTGVVMLCIKVPAESPKPGYWKVEYENGKCLYWKLYPIEVNQSVKEFCSTH